MQLKSLLKRSLVLLFFVVFAGYASAQTTIYKRLSVIPPRVQDPEGYGNLVAGYDVTGSGAPQIYAVSGELNLGGIIPRIYEFKYNGTTWDSVWASVPELSDQNTWCPLTVADLDGDGKMEVVWGPVNALSSTVTNPIRLLDYEAQGGGSDALGVPDGSGGYKANATWTMTDSVSYNTRPFRWVAADVNNDGKQELIFTTRAGGYHFGVVSVDNIPDNGDGSETWKLDTSGIGGGTGAFSYPDLAVIDSTIYMFNYGNGDMQPVYYANGKYTIGKVYPAVAPGGTWKSAQVVDLAGDGKKEILIGSVSDGKVYLLQPAGDSLSTTEVGDFGPLGCKRLNGSALGDFNGDGHTDIAFGSRSGYSTPDASIYVLYYNGGDITSMSSYSTALVDSSVKSGDQWDILSSGKIDADASTDEIVYSGIDRSGIAAPIVALSTMKVDSLSSIADARLDANADGVPDNLGSTFKVMGTVNSVNWGASSGYFSYTIQDGSAGIDLYKYGNGTGPMLNVGDRVIATGTVKQYNGVDELSLTDSSDISLVDTGRVISPKTISIDELSKNGEMYESMVVTIDGVAPAPTNKATWPAAGSNASFKIWDGYSTLSMYIDKDTELDGMTEPTYPVNVTGVVGQFSSATPPLGGYEIEPVVYSDFKQNVAAAPNPHFYFTDELHTQAQSTIQLKDSTADFILAWHPAVDLNGDAVIYQIKGDVDGTAVISGGSDNGGKDTTYTLKAADILKAMAGKDSLMIDFTLAVKSVGTTEPVVESVDTLHAMIVNAILTDVKSDGVPTSFFVDQNYPNPFNPTTTIKFGLRQENRVDLRVYDILGRQVAVLIDNQNMRSGVHEVQFNASQLASGTYIYRLKSGNNTVIKKMVLLK